MKALIEEYGGLIVEIICGFTVMGLLYWLIDANSALPNLPMIADSVASLIMGGD